MSITVQVMGLGGSSTHTLNDDATVADVREAAGLSAGLILRSNGNTIRDEEQPVQDNQVFVSAAPEAKHGC